MTICEYIDSELKLRGKSRRWLALRAGIPPSSLQSAFQRNTYLSLEMLIRIVCALELDGEVVAQCDGGERYGMCL